VPNMDVTEGWRKLHNGEPHDLCPSLDILGMIKSRMMRWARHVACVGEGGFLTVF
jgi:hypothetical protein